MLAPQTATSPERVDMVSLALVELHWLPVESTLYQGRGPSLGESFLCRWTVCLELFECLRMFDLQPLSNAI